MHNVPLYPKWFYTLAWMVALCAGIATVYMLATARRPPMNPALLLFFALCCSFLWVEVWKIWNKTKPFNCMKCMCGWFAFALAVYTKSPYCLLYAVAGVFVGAMYGAIKMRWL